MTDESTRSRRVAIAEGEPETFYLKWANLSHKYKFFTLILGCIFLAATIGPFLSAALYTASGDLAVMPSFALTRQRGLASKDLKNWFFSSQQALWTADSYIWHHPVTLIVLIWDRKWEWSQIYLQVFCVHGLCHVVNLLYCLLLPEPRSTKAEAPSVKKLLSFYHFR